MGICWEKLASWLSVNAVSLNTALICLRFFPLWSLGQDVEIDCIIASLPFHLLYKTEPAHDKTYNKTCATSEDSDQPAHQRILI